MIIIWSKIGCQRHSYITTQVKSDQNYIWCMYQKSESMYQKWCDSIYYFLLCYPLAFFKFVPNDLPYTWNDRISEIVIIVSISLVQLGTDYILPDDIHRTFTKRLARKVIQQQKTHLKSLVALIDKSIRNWFSQIERKDGHTHKWNDWMAYNCNWKLSVQTHGTLSSYVLHSQTNAHWLLLSSCFFVFVFVFCAVYVLTRLPPLFFFNISSNGTAF